MAHSWKQGFASQKLDLIHRAAACGADKETLAKLWEKYDALIRAERAKNGLPPLEQTVVPPRDLIHSKLLNALSIIERVLQAGERKYPDEKWKTQQRYEHVSHALLHLLQVHLGLESDEDHLAHAACRLLMALEKRYV